MSGLRAVTVKRDKFAGEVYLPLVPGINAFIHHD